MAAEGLRADPTPPLQITVCVHDDLCTHTIPDLLKWDPPLNLQPEKFPSESKWLRLKVWRKRTLETFSHDENANKISLLRLKT